MSWFSSHLACQHLKAVFPPELSRHELPDAADPRCSPRRPVHISSLLANSSMNADVERPALHKAFEFFRSSLNQDATPTMVQLEAQGV